jgi:hypothetical protein
VPSSSAPLLSLPLQALGIAAVKAVVCIVGITAGGRLLIRPLYKKISGLANAEIFAATTLLVVLGTSFMTQLAGAAVQEVYGLQEEAGSSHAHYNTAAACLHCTAATIAEQQV